MVFKRDLADEIIYGANQYYTLVEATVATSTLSMMSSLFIIVAYIYLRIYNPSKANRVSLRCVFMTSIMNLINSVFDITSILQYGDTVFCRSSSVVTMFTRVMSAAFLTLVGINLLLVFVLNVKTSASQLEWIYYPSAFIYGLITIAIPISEQSKGPLNPPESSNNKYRCYYYVNYYQLMGHSSLLWMWFYGFLFLTVVIAMLCSIIALVKLMREHHVLIGKFTIIANNSPTQDVSTSHVQDRIKTQSNIFMRVVSRCVIYPLVPLICNIWGFVFQLILNNPHASPHFALSMIDTVFKDLQGFFVALVFFSDPAMTEFISTRFSSWKHKYVDEFSQIRKFNDGQIQILFPPCSSTASTAAAAGAATAAGTERKSSNTSSILPTHVPSLTTLQTVRMHSFSSNDYFMEKRKFGSHDEPMRRMSVSPSIYSRISHQHNRQDSIGVDIISHPPSIYNVSIANSESRPSTVLNNMAVCFADPERENRVFVPYAHPKLASIIHWTLVHCGFKSKTTTVTDMPEQQSNCTTTHPLHQQ